LIAASTVGIPTDSDEELVQRMRQQLLGWYGSDVATWRVLRVDRIPEALPKQIPGSLDPWQRPVRLHPGLYVCGDHRDQASIDGALCSGFRTAQAVAADLAEKLQ
ncbi:MAG: FAD-dependent oxidoreductase, partial [Gemmataceae bacterium]